MNKKYKAVIVDDEVLSRDLLSSFLKSHPDIEIVGEAANGEQAVVLVDQYKPDILFLDIQMPEMNGFEVLRNIATLHNPSVIIVSAFDHYAVKAFDAEAIDYLLKPFNRQRFDIALTKVRTNLQRNSLKDFLAAYEKLLIPADPYINKIMVREPKRIHFIAVQDIYSLEAAGDYVTVHTESKSHLVNDSLNQLEKKLNPNTFVRIHRSTIINLNVIKELYPYFNGEYFIQLKNNRQVKLSRSYKGSFKAHFDERL